MKGLCTPKQLADLQEKRNGLVHRIQNWRDVQLVYTPHVASLIPETQVPEANVHSATVPPETLPENIPLYLPSSLPTSIRTLPELREACQLERRLREPHADDALAEVRRQRRVIQGLWHFKRFNVSGTGNKPNTRMVELYKHFNNKTKRAAEKYRAAWRALRVLDPDGSWSSRLKELKDLDISGPGKDPNDLSTTTSRYEPSWIWLVPRGTEPSDSEVGMGEEFHDSIRLEWANARARMLRWREELLIVQEEMRRVVTYHTWKAAWWRDCGLLRTGGDKTILSGLSGYAHKQAAICSRMAEQCALHWLLHLKSKGIVPSWAVDYESALSQAQPHVAAEVDEDEDVSIEGNGYELDFDSDEDNMDLEMDEDEYSNFDRYQ
jgi:hypothetical protein